MSEQLHARERVREVRTEVKRPGLRQRFLPRALPVRDYIGLNLIIAVVLELLQAAVISGLAISRANGHRLSATATAVILGVSPVLAVIFGGMLAYFSGLSETLGGLIVRTGAHVDPVEGDPLSVKSLWGRALRAAVVAGAW